MVRHLLLLREQITPFNADLAVTERDLDFAHMRDYLRRLLAGMQKFTVLLLCRCWPLANGCAALQQG